MFKKLSFLLAGFFCSGLFMARAATLPMLTQKTSAPVQQLPMTQQVQAGQTQQVLNGDRFNFVIANPNTVDPKKFIFELRPGEQAQDEVLVKNASDIPLKFSLYGADGTKTVQGSFGLKTKAQVQTELGKWISFDESEFTLLPGEIRKVKFTVQVPFGTPEGTYSGGVAAEKTKQDAGNPNITIAVRIALRVDVNVTSNPQPVPKEYAEPLANPFFQGYFWASVLLFLASVGALAWSYFSEEKPGRKSRKHKK